MSALPGPAVLGDPRGVPFAPPLYKKKSQSINQKNTSLSLSVFLLKSTSVVLSQRTTMNNYARIHLSRISKLCDEEEKVHFSLFECEKVMHVIFAATRGEQEFFVWFFFFCSRTSYSCWRHDQPILWRRRRGRFRFLL